MRTHSRRGRRSRRAFSLLEFGVSLGLFLLLATFLSIGISAALNASATTRAAGVATRALSAELDKVAAIDYGSLLQNTFTAPDLCADSRPGSGVAGASCVPVPGRTLRITYHYQGVDASGAATCTATSPSVSAKRDGYLGLCATTESVPGASPQASRQVNAPVAGYSPGEGSLRVTLTGDVAQLPGPVYLLPVADPAAPVASATPDAHGVVLLHADAGKCTTAAPCMLGLEPTAHPADVGGYGLIHSTAVGPGATLTLTTGRLAEASATVAKLGTATVQLWAANDDGGNAATNPVAGSVCLWARFVDDGAQHTVPVCNTGTDPGAITLAGYDPTWGQPADTGLTLPLPTGTAISLTTDSPDGACPHAPGMLGSSPSAAAGADHPAGWLPAAVCTSWTWGQPGTFGPADKTAGPATGMSVTLTGGAADSYKLTWSGADARPAAGIDSDPTWAKPREAVGCAFDGTCRSQAGAAPPEVADCPSSAPYCLSGADDAPTLTAPASGAVALDPSGVTAFPVTLADPDHGAITATVAALPTDGTLSAAGSPLAVGDTLVSAATGPTSVNLTYTAAAGVTAVRDFQLKLSDDGGATRTVDVGLYHAVVGWTVAGKDVTAAQGATGVPVAVTVTGTDGKPLAGDTVTFSSDPGITFANASVTTDTNGVAATTAAFPTATAGTHTLTATAGDSGRSGTLSAAVTAAAGRLDLTAVGGAQGGRGSLTVTTRDLSGAPFGGAAVTVVALSGGKPSDAVYPEYAGCVTGTDGACTVALVVDPDAPAGSYTVRASSGAFTAATQVTVTPVPSTVQITDGGTVAEGASTTVAGRLLDGAGSAMPSTVLTVAGNPAGMTLGPQSATTDAAGTFTLTATAAATAAPGPRQMTLTVAGRTVTAPLTVTGAPAAAAPAPASVAQGGSATLQVTVDDGTGAPLPKATVTFGAAVHGLAVSTRAITDASGVATATLAADAALPTGTYPVTVTTGSVVLTAHVAVTATPASLALSGAVTQGGSSPLTVTVVDGAGTPIGGTQVTLTGLPGTLTAAPGAATTDGSGRATFTVTDGGPTPAGTYTVTVHAGGTVLPAVVTVVAEPGSLTPTPAYATVAPGGTTTLTVTLLDKTGAPLPGVDVAVTGLPTGVTADPPAPTDPSGTTTVTLRAAADAAPGNGTVRLTAGTLTRTVPLTVG